MTKVDKYIIYVDYDNETGENHTTVLKTDRTNNMKNWETLVDAMYTHPTIFEEIIAELNKVYNENEQLKEENEAAKYKLEDMGVSDFKYGGVRYYTGLCGDLND